MQRKWRSAAVTAVWAAGATAVGGLGAWSLAGLDGAGRGGRPLDDTAVRRALSAAPSALADSPSPSSGSQPAPPSTPSTHRKTIRFTGGTATVECRTSDLAYLVSWSPDDGYHVEEYARGPAAVASIELESAVEDDAADDEDDTTYEFRCTDGRPRLDSPPADD
ncbi:hypothetical protein [Streptomyces sp. NBC_01304]|uniref:hypothetical protein n=1 Tax=Streptomyces sp. NBC_01304 TaxID=2903818 RepID=UPI002E0E7BBB|nr:hypothetical protein OG430_19325 [Streptomyces sp. NBC_01304]